MKANIFNIQKFCLHDGPGIRTTVFFKGCNLRCSWCANPESQCSFRELTLDPELCRRCGICAAKCPAGARRMEETPVVDPAACTNCAGCMEVCPAQAIGMEGREASLQEILEEVKKDKAFYDHSGGGVTFSGGEVLLQQEFAAELARRLHEEGIHVAAETAACVPRERFEALLRELDYIFIDLKHHDPLRHREGTGLGNELALSNIRIAAESGKAMKIRIPVIPGYNDAIADAEAFARLLLSMNIHEVQLLPFHQLGEKKYSLLGREYSYRDVPQLHREDLNAYTEAFACLGVRAEI